MMITNRKMIVSIVIALSVLLAGCGPGQLFGPTLTPTATSTITPTNTPTPTNTLTPTHTSTTTPTSTITYTPTITATYTLTPIPTQITDDFGVPMALVPAGPFEMGGDVDFALEECEKQYIGCQRTSFEDREPIHTITLDTYYIDLYEVTNARYAECVDAGDCDLPRDSRSDTRSSYYGDSQFDDYPLVYVSWYDAQTYCEWRNARLPSEAEWEKAARGEEGYIFPWGNEFDGTLANFCDSNCEYYQKNVDFDDGYVDTAPVGSYSANSYGLYDMAGNVWEWVSDWYDVYPGGNAEDSDDFGERYRVVRGGSWYADVLSLMASSRGVYKPDLSNVNVGFRCVRSP